MRLFATCPKGVEPILFDECRSIRLRKPRLGRGGVTFEGGIEEAMVACLWLRTANRVLAPLSEFACTDAETLYAGAREVAWEAHIGPRTTFAVQALGTTPELVHTHFTALRVKDAIADRLRELRGSRPDVDPKDPDVRVVAHLTGKRCTLSLDAAGESLHRRGYRRVSVDAPLRETLAAAMVQASGWDRQMPFVDPMCGGGTIPIEAAMWARRMAPGLGARHGFLRWPTFGDAEQAAWQALCEEARRVSLPASPAQIVAVDRDPDAVEAARTNARAAGVERDIEFACDDGVNLTLPPAPGLIVTNPPYGERVGEAGRPMQDFFRRLSTGFRRYRGYDAWILSGNTEFERQFARRWSERLDLFNGPIPCQLFHYQL